MQIFGDDRHDHSNGEGSAITSRVLRAPEQNTDTNSKNFEK